jgi:hypothetical protein
MPRGRSSFTKRQKEQARQQKQREKALRRSERNQAKPESTTEDLSELQEHAAAQAALFNIGEDEDIGEDETDDSSEITGASRVQENR